MAAVDLDANRWRRRVLVRRRESRVRRLGELRDVRFEQRRLVFLDHEDEVIRLDLVIVLERVEQIERVLDPDVVRIAGERRRQVLFPRRDLTEPQLVHA